MTIGVLEQRISHMMHEKELMYEREELGKKEMKQKLQEYTDK